MALPIENGTTVWLHCLYQATVSCDAFCWRLFVCQFYMKWKMDGNVFLCWCYRTVNTQTVMGGSRLDDWWKERAFIRDPRCHKRFGKVLHASRYSLIVFVCQTFRSVQNIALKLEYSQRFVFFFNCFQSFSYMHACNLRYQCNNKCEWLSHKQYF